MNREDVLKIAKLANINITEEEADSYRENLCSMVEFISEIEKFNEGEENFTVRFTTPLREDEIEKSLPREEILSNAPKSSDGFFAVDEKG